MFKDFSFLLPILIIGISNVVILSLPSVLLWFEGWLSDNGKSCSWINRYSINLYSILITLLCTIVEIGFLIFVFTTNGITNMLYCLLYQVILFAIIGIIPQTIYQIFKLLKNIGMFLYEFLKTAFSGILGASTIILFIPLVIYGIAKYAILKILKKV